MIKEVITYPNPKLREVSKDVTTFDEALHEILDDMYETMIHKNGIGLAAIQISTPLNILVINLANEDGMQDKTDLFEVINPVIVEQSGICTYQEGCLSVPEIYEDVERAKVIKLKYQDRHGDEFTKEFDGLMAIALQHEIDHLRGHLFIEKLSYLKRKKFEKEYKQMQKDKKQQKKRNL
ncbi:MAG: peptide deformylase [Campylobacteraceae bacterium]